MTSLSSLIFIQLGPQIIFSRTGLRTAYYSIVPLCIVLVVTAFFSLPIAWIIVTAFGEIGVVAYTRAQFQALVEKYGSSKVPSAKHKTALTYKEKVLIEAAMAMTTTSVQRYMSGEVPPSNNGVTILHPNTSLMDAMVQMGEEDALVAQVQDEENGQVMGSITFAAVLGRLIKVPSGFAKLCHTSITDKFKEHHVVPDVIQQAPANQMEVHYGSDLVGLGNILTPDQVKDPPTHIHWPVDAGSLYTLIMKDADCPSRLNPKRQERIQWLVVNVPGTNVNSGQAIMKYGGMGPPKVTGLHRCVFLVYKQQGKINDTGIDKREGWKAEEFVKKHHLEVPVAGNFFQVEWIDEDSQSMAI